MSNIIKLKRKCPICNNDSGEEILNLSFNMPASNPLPLKSMVVSCRKCGFTFADMESSQESFNYYYSNFNMYSETEDIKEKEFELATRYSEGERLIARFADRESKIIDIGCGDGGFLEYLKEKGYSNLFGLDPSAESIGRLTKMGVQGIIGNVFDDISDNLRCKFDVVISTMVIEHIYDLNHYMKNLSAYMNKDSLLLLMAPAVEGFCECVRPIANYFNHEHINYFSQKSLENLLKKYGLKRLNENPYFEMEIGEKGLIVLCKKIMKVDNEAEITYDNLSKKKIEEYLSLIDEEKQIKQINDVIRSEKKIVIWGYGSYAMQILTRYPELLNRVEYIVDNNSTKHGMMIEDKTIYAPDILLNCEEELIILICSMRNAKDIEVQIKNMGVEHELVIL